MAVTSPNFEAHITHVDKEGQLIKIFAQINKQHSLIVEKNLYRFYDIFEKQSELKPKTLNDITLGLLCCAKFEDDMYYRAKIISLNALNEHKVLVTFIDHGNRALVNVRDIRLLSKLANMVDKNETKIFTLPNLAFEYYLGGVVPKNKEWDDDTIDFLRQTLCNTDSICQSFDVEGKQIIKFLDPKNDPANMLVSLNKAFPVEMDATQRIIRNMNEKKTLHPSTHGQINLSVPPPGLLMQQPPPARLPNLSQPPPIRMLPEGTFPRVPQPQMMSARLINPGIRSGVSVPGIRKPETRQAPPVVQALQLSTEMLNPGSTYQVIVSHVDDGPLAFAVQLQTVVDEVLVPLMVELARLKPQPITGPLNPGSICLGRYSLDKSLCRAIVTSVRDDKVKLYFADFGHSELLPYSEIFQIPPEFAVQKVMSHRFTLANIKGVTYSEKEKKLFSYLVHKTPNLMLKVMPPEANPLKQYCELYVNSKNIKNILKELSQNEMQLRYTPLPVPFRESQEEVTVSFVLNPGRFFVQLVKNNFQLKQVMSCVADHCRTAPHMLLPDIRVNEPCCALFDDDQWYRAEIFKVNGDKAYINFVDYGNQEEVELSKLRQITPELVNSVRAQAVACCLQGYETCYTVDEEVANRLEELILEQTLTMHVVGQTNYGVLIVKLLDKRNQDIRALLDARPVLGQAHNIVRPVMSPPAPAAPAATADNGWDDSESKVSSGYNRDDRRTNEPRGARFNRGVKWSAPSHGQTKENHHFNNKRFNRDDNKKQWRSREESDGPSRFNKEGGGRWNDGAKPERRFNNDDTSGGRFKRDDDDGGRFNRDGGNRFGDRGSRFNEDDKGGRFGRDAESRGGRFGEDRGGRFNKDDGGGRFNKADEDKQWRKRDDDGGKWKDRDGTSGGWKDKGSSGGDWKDGSGDRRNKFDGEGGFKRGNFNRDGDNDGGYKRGGYNRDSENDGGTKRGGYNRDGDNEGGFKRGGYNREFSGDKGGFRKPWERGSGDCQARSSPKTPKPDTLGGIALSKVKVGSTENTQVVFTTSPVEFYVQLNNSYDELSQLMEKIATACTSGDATDLSSPQEKTACLAQYSTDETWYRGYIEEKTFDKAKILFVDYGNREDVPLDKIKTLAEDMCTLPVQAVKCRLYGVPETAEADTFSELVDGKNLVTQFVAKHFLTNSFEVILVDEESGSNINTVMGASAEEVQLASSKLGLVTLSPAHYPHGTALPTQMTWYISPAQFYLQSLNTHPEFRAMMQSMQSVVRTGSVKQNNELTVGDYVIARFKADRVLYRALVKETGFLPTVQFVDYGNTENVDSGGVWAMETEYATLPTQAICCCLAGVQPSSEAWPKAGSTALDQVFEADSLECTLVSELDGEVQYLVKLAANGQDVAQKIIEGGFGVAGSDGVGAPVELDTSLLVGQLLPVRLVKVADNNRLYVQPADEDTAELQSLILKTGSGIKCSLSSVREDSTDEERAQLAAMAPDTHLIVMVDAAQTDGIQVTVYDEEGMLLPLQSSETTSVNVICPLPVLNTHQKVWVSHAGEDGIYLQKSAFGDLVSELLQKLYEFYSESEAADQEWAVDDVCSAKSVNDEQWYRARVIETGEEIKVQYVDYGNCESLPATNLRKLDNSFYTPHAFAVKASFHVTWTVPQENLLELTEGVEYSALILRKDSGWIVELVDSSGQSLTEKLVELGFANALENSPFKRIVEGGRFVEGSSIPISVSFIDSPVQIWIFVGDDIELVEALQDRLQEAAPKLPQLNVPNGIFAAKFSDGLWYRATKLDESKVRFIDYGNSDVVNMSDIKALSADFLESAEGYAVKVELPVLDFKDGAKDRLEELLVTPEIDSGEEIIAQILTIKENSIVADISKGGKSMVDILVEENLGTRLVNVFSGFVSHITSLDNFFIQEVGCEELLEAMATSMSSAENFPAISTFNVGSIVAALFSDDGLWYRAKIISNQDNVTEVLFIDYGNSSTASEFRELPSDVAAKPPLSKHCALQLPKDVSRWSEAATNKFIELSAEGCTQFDVQMVDDKDPATVLLTCKGKCVIEELKPFYDTVIDTEECEAEKVSLDLTGYDKIVYISHVNSPNSFYAQVDGAETELDSIKEQLLDTSSFEAIDQISEEVKGNIIGALFDDDESWYRAKILKTEDDKSEVLFVDYGNSATSTKFIKLSEDLENKKPVAIHCALGKEEWPVEANDRFVELTAEGSVPFHMKIIEEGEPNLVSLITDEIVVERELRSLFKQTLHEDKTSGVDDLIKTVYLIQVNSPSDFFLHTSEATQQVEEISERLVAAEDFEMVDDGCKTKGTIVAAQIDEDDLWYRAKILEFSENETKVLFIDYGNTAKVAKIKSLPEELVSTPPLAMHCSLQMPGVDNWSVKACETFNKLANDDGITFDLKVISEGEPNQVALYINGESVAEQLMLASSLVTEVSPVKEKVSLADDVTGTNNNLDDIADKKIEPINTAESTETIKVVQLTPKKNSKDGKEEDLNASEDTPKTATISHYNNINDFYVQITDNQEELDAINEELVDGESFETILDDEEILAAKYSSDGLWYRAKILDSKDSGSTVLFVDYGNTDVTNEFRKLPKHLVQKMPSAKHCCLKSTKGPWTESADKNLSELAKIGGIEFEMKVLEEGDPCVVDLFIAGKSVMETFIEEEKLNGESIKETDKKETCDNTNSDVENITDSSLDEDNTTKREMEDMIMKSVEKEINDIAINDVKHITDDLIFNATNVAESTDNSNNLSTGESKVNELNSSQSDKIKIIDTENTPSNMKDLENHPQGKESKTNDSNIRDNIPNSSPPAPRRTNIDDHIVPGCISSVKLDESPNQS